MFQAKIVLTVLSISVLTVALGVFTPTPVAGQNPEPSPTEPVQTNENFTEQMLDELLDENPITENLSAEGSGGLRDYFERFSPGALRRFAFGDLPEEALSFAHTLAEFGKAEATALILQAFLIVIIVAALRLRRKKIARKKKDELQAGSGSKTETSGETNAEAKSNARPEAAEKQTGRLWLNRPFSVGILAALALTPLMISGIPDAIQNVFYLIALGPALRILGPRLHRKFRRLFYIFVIVLGLHLLTQLLEPATTLYFPIGMLVMAAAILLLRAGTDTESRGLRLAEWYGRGRLAVGAAFLCAAAIDAMGYGTLGKFLGEGLLYSVTALPATIAVVRVLHDVLLRFLDSRVAQWAPIQRRRLGLQKSALGTLRRLAAFGWILISLAAFDVLGRLYNLLSLILGYEVTLGSFALSPGDLAAFALIFWLALKIAATIRSVLAETTTERMDMDRGASYALATVAQYIIIALGFFIGITAAGFDLTKLAIVAGALGVGIGLGLQDIVKNFVSGLVLLFERPITVGDYIEVDDMIGQVERIGIRSSTVRIVDGSDVIVPNGMLLSEKVRNWTLTDYKRRIDVNVGVAYGSDPKLVLKLLDEAARRQEHIIPGEDPQVYFLGFGDSSLDFTVRVFTEQITLRLQIQSELTTSVYSALNEAGVEIPFPQRDLHIRSSAIDPGLQEKS
ncbi:MAG: mechanosensitive ion channel [Leptospirales bacterium]|jgi:potassium efflux system protein